MGLAGDISYKEPYFARRGGLKIIKFSYANKATRQHCEPELVSNAYGLEWAYLNELPVWLPGEYRGLVIAGAEKLMGGKIQTTEQFCEKLRTSSLRKINLT